MNNVERAAEIIDDELSKDPEVYEALFGDEPAAIVYKLLDAGLLIPDVDVPEPSYCVQEFGDIYLGQSLEWEDYGISIVFGKRVGGDRGPELFAEGQDFSSSGSVKEYVAYLLEAAKEMEKMEAANG